MNYYNEHDKKATAWLRELVRRGEIPPGDVDERDIQKVSPHELTRYTQCHFFAGVAGWSLALRLAGWPEDRPVWTGSCPCQPFSSAGAQKGFDDERHLWPVFARLIGECRPPVVFGEQVASKLGREWFAGVCSDLEGLGYAAAGADLCAAGVGAPHIRQRLYWVAYPDMSQRDRRTRGGEQPLCVENEIAGGVDEPAGEGRCGREQVRAGGHPELGGPGETGWLAHTPLGGQRINGGASGIAGHADEREQAGGVEHAVESRLEGYSRDVHHRGQPRWLGAGPDRPAPASGGAWDSFDPLPCTDGKSRRVESGTFPLAHGVPGRVGLLRGYGNAIVPPLAARFIQASEEAGVGFDLI